MWTEEHLRIFRREGNGYPTDLRDAECAWLEPLIPIASPGGRPRKTQLAIALGHPFVAQREGAGAPRVGRVVALDRPCESEPSASSPPAAISRYPPARTASQ